MTTGEIVKIIQDTTDKYVDDNLGEVMDWTSLSEDQIFHIKDIARSITIEREKLNMGGRFAKAILDNNLKNAISWGDGLCLRALKLFVMVKENVQIK